MNSSTKPSKGYYSILQFVPDLERAESANIGVVLFCPERRFLDAKVSTNNDRIIHFFGGKNFDLLRIKAMKASFAERVRGSVASIRSGDDFQLFVDTRANSLRLTDPRPMKVFEPASELSKLFNLLVGVRQKAAQTPITTEQIIRKLGNEIKKRHITNLVQRNVRIELPLFHKTETYPFAFQNGRLNLVKPAVFGIDMELVVQKASKLALEGRSLLDRAHKLTVIAGFNNGRERSVVKDVLNQFEVELFEATDTEKFADLIAKTAHV